MPLDAVLVFVAYLLGSLSSAVIVCRALGLADPRGVGSGNPGATNVLRFGGRKAAAATLAGDLVKGLAPVVVAKFLGVGPLALGLVGLAAFLGHLYPVFFGFQGGKGVATALGVWLGIDWRLGLALGLVWLAMAAVVRISSVGALSAALLAPLAVAWLEGSPALTVTTAAISLMLFWRHRSNLRNLLAGTERRIGR
ncbi:putative glycerol-3-phosphate acyltransferase [bacterium BMS3Bbin12]|nr:putative glycerol-3-phosphate acyltransferase [bacterium BMS3Abin12]GBE47022.1 putative glycerol-3-phosphate acyltransferase [bacterium BMS3Bbin12]GBE50472.1 putative glycerol-3-phosphate acyltransferase [bacterium BMS3Bbin13]HDJ85510.1 glycerol-3-phosphate 1-O-acyltransferase [Chromatiales bacterium]